MAATRGAVDAFGTATQRPGAGKKWSEVCSVVQQPNGSVRTSPSFKNIEGSVSVLASPSHPRRAGCGSRLGLRRLSRSGLGTNGLASDRSSRGSRGGSSGKSSRSSSRDLHAHDGDISSRCSSAYWETSTNDSEPSRPRTPPDTAPLPSGGKGLCMPDPIRTSILLPSALLDDESAMSDGKASDSTALTSDEILVVPEVGPQKWDSGAGEQRPGMPLKWDPFGRDSTRRASGTKVTWCVDPLLKYLNDVARQIDANLREERLPTAQRFDTYVHRLVANTQRQVKNAPTKVRHPLQALFSKHFQKFWHFQRNEKVRTSTPEELKHVLVGLIENIEHLRAHGVGAATAA